MKNNAEKVDLGIWKYLHHLMSGAVLLIEGIILIFLGESLIISIIFILIGAALFIDDFIAETNIGTSIFDKWYQKNPKQVKWAGLLFFLFMEIIFIMVLII